MIRNYSDFVEALLKAGFSLAGGNPKGIYSVVPFSWEDQQNKLTETPIRWHTEDPETDPWEWRMRVLEERRDISYAKVFFRIGGYITREWIADFWAFRRGGDSFRDAYETGAYSYGARRIMEVVQAEGPCLLPNLKRLAGFTGGRGGEFEQTVTELQSRMFLTICGQAKRRNRYGEEFGWNCTKLCTLEQFWGPEVAEEAADTDPEDAGERITERIRELNPAATERNIRRFLTGEM